MKCHFSGVFTWCFIFVMSSLFINLCGSFVLCWCVRTMCVHIFVYTPYLQIKKNWSTHQTCITNQNKFVYTVVLYKLRHICLHTVLTNDDIFVNTPCLQIKTNLSTHRAYKWRHIGSPTVSVDAGLGLTRPQICT